MQWPARGLGSPHHAAQVWDDSVITITGDTLVLFWFAAAAFFEEASWGAIYTYSVEVALSAQCCAEL